MRSHLVEAVIRTASASCRCSACLPSSPMAAGIFMFYFERIRVPIRNEDGKVIVVAGARLVKFLQAVHSAN